MMDNNGEGEDRCIGSDGIFVMGEEKVTSGATFKVRITSLAMNIRDAWRWVAT